jgi:hypothetical protein
MKAFRFFEISDATRLNNRAIHRVHGTLASLIDRLDDSAILGTDIIKWGCPVPSFGDLGSARIATVGLNPSNKEFVDDSGNELQGKFRRFHTLASLGLGSWAEADARHIRLILESCQRYFLGNPYDRWFRILEQVIGGADATFYGDIGSACHLDLIPYATAQKWMDLTPRQKSALLEISRDTLALLLRDSEVQTLILNGKSVIEHFEYVAGVSLERTRMHEWALPRASGDAVTGFAYSAVVNTLSGFRLPRELLVLGYNHNLQSSFGVSAKVIRSIRVWVAEQIQRKV